MKYEIEELVEIADSLDACGLHSEAENLDTIIEKIGTSSGAVTAFVSKLKSAFELAAKQPELGESFGANTLHMINSIIDTVQESGQFLEYKAGPKEVERLKMMSNEPASKALHLLELERSIPDIKKEMETETDPDKIRLLKIDLMNDERDLQDILEKVKQWKSGQRDNDIASYKLFTSVYNNRGEV